MKLSEGGVKRRESLSKPAQRRALLSHRGDCDSTELSEGDAGPL